MRLTATVQEGHIWLATAATTVEIAPQRWLPLEG
jgi:uncharacterized protein YaeQ